MLIIAILVLIFFNKRFPDVVPRGRFFHRKRLRGSRTKVIEENTGEDQNNLNIQKRQTIYYSDKPDSSDKIMTIPSNGNSNGFFDDIFQVDKLYLFRTFRNAFFRKAKETLNFLILFNLMLLIFIFNPFNSCRYQYQR